MTMLSPPEIRTESPEAVKRTSQTAAALAIAIFAALSLAASLCSDGFLEADGCTHYLYARFALEEPHFLVNVWGRPLFTALYAVPSAYGGLLAARTLSLILAVVCAIVAMLIARGQSYRWPVVALIFTLAQPLVFLHSFSELTELPFAALIGLAFLAYQRRQWLAMAVLAGLAPLGRPEGFGFIMLAAVALVLHRRALWVGLLPVPLILWNHAGWAVSGHQGPWWGWLLSNWPYSQQSLYESGNPSHFIALLPAVTSPLIFPATSLGIWLSLRGRIRARDHRDVCEKLIAAIPLLILVGHSVLYATGRMASSGELRYMLVVAPFWGLLGARGFAWIVEHLRFRRPLLWAAGAALGGALANALYPVVPLQAKPDEDFGRSRRFVQWYRRSGVEATFPRVCTGQMFIYYLLDVSPLDPVRALEFHRDVALDPPPGTILIWDPVYSLYNADARRSIPLNELLKHGWIEDPAFTPGISDWRLLRSPKP